MTERYAFDAWRLVAGIVTGEITGDEALVAAALLRADGIPAESPAALLDSLRNLYATGWLAVEDGRAYQSIPVHGPDGALIGRERATEEDKQIMRELEQDPIVIAGMRDVTPSPEETAHRMGGYIMGVPPPTMRDIPTRSDQ